LLLDTGPIRELVLFHAVEHLRFQSLRGELRFMRDRPSYRKCSQFIASFRRRVTSASVVVELYHWIRDTDRTGQERLWNRVYEEFEAMGMEEELVRLLDMDSRLVARLGPADVSLLELARRHVADKPVLLTAESRAYAGLYAACKNVGIDVYDIGRITSA
jgi:hypothetical protein